MDNTGTIDREQRTRITEIAPSLAHQPGRKRACAYVRVSTSHDEQKNSLENQTQYYYKLLTSRSDYEFRGVFSDEGISGAKENRPRFRRMMEEARQGRLDLIYTKSISRFARNTLLLLQSIRELKALGVGVVFEEQNINTLEAEGEFLLSILASIAEEERKSVSANNKWTYQSRFKRGDCNIVATTPYGYEHREDGSLAINREQARSINNDEITSCWTL
jgi:DNA invertase Pin-like site-specific DNA recombinase